LIVYVGYGRLSAQKLKVYGLSFKPLNKEHNFKPLDKLSCICGLLVFNATFSNISVVSWRPVLVVEEAGVPGENHRPWASNW
jgi:hypothetical protein